MRSQRRAPVTVTLVAISRAGDDGISNFTEAEATAVVKGAIFQPEQLAERAGEDQAHVLQPASWDVPGAYSLGANDEVRYGDEVWYVTAGSTAWLDRTNIPVSRTRVQ